MCLNDCVLSEDVLNEAEQASNSLIPKKSKGRYLKSNETIKQIRLQLKIKVLCWRIFMNW
jgi:hypothetical protein